MALESSLLRTQDSALSTRPTEALLATVWQRQWLDGGPLVDSLGRELRVVYPGRRWGGPGPDFQGAVLALEDGSLLRGDVEVHLRGADWRAHEHHRDAAYNRTVLHVVLRAGPGEAGRRQDGQPLPVLELAPRLAAPLPVLAARLSEGACQSHELACLDTVDDLLRVVDRAALERFFDKAAAFEADLAVFEPAEVFYRALLVALGYSANKRSCGLLGELVPWGLVRRVAREAAGEAQVRALLLGAAGLLPSQRGLAASRGPAEVEALERGWARLRPELGQRPLEAGGWRLAGVRPENTPTRRLVGGAALLAAWAGLDFPAEQLEAIFEHQQRPGQLIERFRARSSSDFWARHYDFDAPTAGPRPWQIGRPRATEIVVNVLLPFGYAFGRATGRDELSAATLLAYRALPASPWNRVSRAMAAQLLGPVGARHCSPAARQQGLLHLFKRFCWERRCDACPAGEHRRSVGAVSGSRG